MDEQANSEVPTGTGRVALTGAVLVDGTGAPRRRGTVVVQGDRIAEVLEEGASFEADEVIDLDGLVLSPGFIDPHTHYDAQVLWDRDLTPSCWHGVTTVVMGNTGFGIAPTKPEGRDMILRTLENVEGMPLEALEAGLPWTFESFPEYLDVLDSEPMRLNVAAFVGHTPVRNFVMGGDCARRPATDAEVEEMRVLVDEAVGAGAIGFSTSRSESHRGAYGLPVPSRAADLEEIRTLAGVLKDHKRGIVEATWGPDLFVDEMADLSRQIDRPVTWAALLPVKGTDYAPDVAARVEKAGGQVFPQIACRPLVVQITLTDPAPFSNVPAFGEILELPREERAGRYADPDWVARAEVQMEERWPGRIGRATVEESDLHTELRLVKTMTEIGADRQVSPLAAMVQLGLEEGLATRFRVVMVNDDEEQIADLMNSDRYMLGLSDAGAHTSQICDANAVTFLLAHWVRERHLLSLERAVWRITGQPAQVFGLSDRGVLAPGMMADLVAFDPDTVGSEPAQRIRDFPGGSDRLIARSIGIRRVWVAGVQTIHDGEMIEGRRPGRLLRAA